MGIEVKERPILFSGEMVRALLEGRKTQTRRVVKFKGDPPHTIFPLIGRDNTPTGDWFFSDPIYERVGRSGNYCPDGKPGERLWVRETSIIAPQFWNDGTDANCVDSDGIKRLVQYLATSPNRDAANDYQLKVTPPLFMPRWASRITLEVTEVRVQRLQEIGFEDCVAEGISYKEGLKHGGGSYRLAYEHLWESINGPGSWAANPWVWAVSFKVVT